MSDIIAEHEFETSAEAWDFMVEGNKKPDRRFSVCRSNTRLVFEHEYQESAHDENFVPPRVHVISDVIGHGINGLKNMADGKMYDSKSSYYKAVKAAGCVVLGDDAPKENTFKPKEPEINWHQEVKRTIDTLSSSTKRKGKRK